MSEADGRLRSAAHTADHGADSNDAECHGADAHCAETHDAECHGAGAHHEIERRFLIDRPSNGALAAWPGAYCYEIEQIYLPADEQGNSARIRCRRGAGGVEYFHTVKQRLTDMTRIETEHRISGEEYEALRSAALASCTADGSVDGLVDGLAKAASCTADGSSNISSNISADISTSGSRLAAITKTRWCLPCGGHLAEVDIYPFWPRRAVVEVELASEDERFCLPPLLCVVREITGERAMSNRDMALEIQRTGRAPLEPD